MTAVHKTIRLKVHAASGNSAVQENPAGAAAVILTNLAAKINEDPGKGYYPLMDVNGNKVGECEFYIDEDDGA